MKNIHYHSFDADAQMIKLATAVVEVYKLKFNR